MARNTILHVRVTTETADRVKELASAAKRSISDWCHLIIEAATRGKTK